MEIRLSISKKSYKVKPTSKEISKMVFEPSTINLPIFAELIKNGYNYCHIYNTSASTFTTSEKTIKNFKSTNIVSLDIDNANKPLEEFIGSLSYAPTISYTTPSNNDTEQLYKLRVIYVFEQPITTNEQYQNIYYNLIHQAETDNQFSNGDNSARNVGQYMNGSYQCRMLNDFNKTYNISDFKNFVFENNNDNIFSLYINLKDKKCNTTKNYAISKEFLNDLNTLEPYQFIKKYKEQYPVFESTPIEYKNGYALLDEDYIEIKRQWTWGSIETSNGLSKLYTITKKLRDGQHRRYYLGLAAMIRRKINPNVSLEHLIVNAVYDRLYYYDNSDGELTNKVLIERCTYVMKLKEINIKSYNKKRYKVDKAYWTALNINANTAKNIIKKQLNYEFIDTWYDTSISLKENYQIANDSDIKISMKTLYRYTKDRDINTNPNKGNKKKHKQNKVSTNTESNINMNYMEPVNDNRNLDLVNELNQLYNESNGNLKEESINDRMTMNIEYFNDGINEMMEKLMNENDINQLTTNYNKAIEWVNKIISKYNLKVDIYAINQELNEVYNNRFNLLNKEESKGQSIKKQFKEESKVISISHLNNNEIYDLLQLIQQQNESDLIINGYLVKKDDTDYTWELIANKHKEFVIKAA